MSDASWEVLSVEHDALSLFDLTPGRAMPPYFGFLETSTRGPVFTRTTAACFSGIDHHEALVL
jgi:hypothetical protein